MKKLLGAIKLKNIIALSICFMLCFSCVFLASGCFMGNPGKIGGETSSGTGGQTGGGSSGGGSTGDEGVDAGNTSNGVVLTIDANGGSYDGYATYKISREVGTTIELKVPTYDDEDYNYTFAGWVKISGNGTLNGNSFTFGSQATSIKATWTGGLLEELDATDYIKGATILYKPSPEINKNNTSIMASIKTEYIEKVEEILTNINKYISGTFSNIENDANTILCNFLNSVYDVTIPTEIAELDAKINYLLPYVDHYGLFENEEQTLTQVILDYIGEDNITADEELYYNKDAVAGFGAEKFYGTRDNNTNTLTFNKDKFDDLNGNEIFDLWTKETFIAKGYCTEKEYDYDSYHYALDLTQDNKLKLNINGLSSEYEIKCFTKNNYDIYCFVNKESKKLIVEGNIETDQTINKVLIDTEDNSLIIKDQNNNEFKPIVFGYITGNNFILCLDDYSFDIMKDNFKNYKNTVKACVENVSCDWKKVPIIYVQQLELKDMSVDFSDTDAEFYDNDILTNKSNSGVSLQGMILDVKQKVNIKSIEVYFEFIDEQNLGVNEIEINIQALYYNKIENKLTTLEFGKVIIQEGETQAVGDNYGDTQEGSSDSVDIDFTKKCGANGITLDVFETQLNNGEYINNTTKTDFVGALDNYEDCFSATMGESGSVASYTDYSSDFLILTFEAEKTNGITPSFKICFFYFDLVKAD